MQRGGKGGGGVERGGKGGGGVDECSTQPDFGEVGSGQLDEALNLFKTGRCKFCYPV